MMRPGSLSAFLAVVVLLGFPASRPLPGWPGLFSPARWGAAGPVWGAEAFTLATASAPELRKMVKQLMSSKRELEANLAAALAQAAELKGLAEEQEKTLALLRTNKQNAAAAAGATSQDDQLRIMELQVTRRIRVVNRYRSSSLSNPHPFFAPTRACF